MVLYVSSEINSGLNFGYIPNFVGVGGIMSPEDALDKLNAGASLIQVYTGFIYNGPSFIYNINKEIIKSLN